MVLIVLDAWGYCRGFARVKAALLVDRECLGLRIGPWVADRKILSAGLLDHFFRDREGPMLVDAPGANLRARRLIEHR